MAGRTARIAIEAAKGLAMGLGLAVLGFFMIGAGHGWTSAWLPSLCSIAGAPLAMVARSLKRSSMRVTLAATTLFGALGLDIFLWIQTMKEGISYVGNVPGFILLLWFPLYFGWQYIAGRTLFRAWRIRDPE